MIRRLLHKLRTIGWPRKVALRRLISGALVLIAAGLAMSPARAPTTPVLVASRDLAPGTTLSTSDVRVVHAPPALVPRQSLTATDAAAGRVLAGAASAGEPITAVRLVGPENTRLTGGLPGSAAVAIRPADPGVADLLTPGAKVDIVAMDNAEERAGTVLAADATVVTVRPSDRGRLVVVTLPRDLATHVAATSLARAVTITLR